MSEILSEKKNAIWVIWNYPIPLFQVDKDCFIVANFTPIITQSYCPEFYFE